MESARNSALAHLSAARSLVREGQLLMRQLPTPSPSGLYDSRQHQLLLHAYQMGDHALKHLESLGLKPETEGSTVVYEDPAEAAAVAERQRLLRSQLSESVASSARAQGFYALVTMAEALRGLGRTF